MVASYSSIAGDRNNADEKGTYELKKEKKAHVRLICKGFEFLW